MKDFMLSWFKRHVPWSKKTFGLGKRTVGLIRHIQSELKEIKKKPSDLGEWVDVVILALDGAWRAGHSPRAILKELARKQAINFNRKWPKPSSQQVPVYHVCERGSRWSQYLMSLSMRKDEHKASSLLSEMGGDGGLPGFVCVHRSCLIAGVRV